MHRLFLRTAAGLCLAPLLTGLGLLRATEPPDLLKKAEGSCGSFGTSVEFVDTPSAAAQRAKKEQKLVFVLHVSGNFEDPRFT
jgi:hypothetical protein